MEIRNLQRTGGTSFTITVPKQWVEKMGLKDKDPLTIHIQPAGTLLIQSITPINKVRRGILHVSTASDERLNRDLIAMYLSGIDEIVIENSKITPQRRSKVREITQSLVGLEIIDESSTKIVIKNIFDITKFPVGQSIEKMFLIAQAMFSDAMQAFIAGNLILAKDVVNRDLEVDKLHFVIIREFQSLITGKLSEENIGMSVVDFNYFEFVAVQIERIADHAVKIAKQVITITQKQQEILYLKTQTQQLVQLLKQTAQMVHSLDTEIAHQILDTYAAGMETKKQEKIEQTIPIISDSLDRVYRYILNIAEMTIDQRAIKNSL